MNNNLTEALKEHPQLNGEDVQTFILGWNAAIDCIQANTEELEGQAFIEATNKIEDYRNEPNYKANNDPFTTAFWAAEEEFM